MYDEIIKLVSVTKTIDEFGDAIETREERKIFAELKSVGQSEFYQAQAVGLKPEIKFVIADYLDYAGEKQLKYAPYNGPEDIYAVIRTYRNENELEITCKRGID